MAQAPAFEGGSYLLEQNFSAFGRLGKRRLGYAGEGWYRHSRIQHHPRNARPNNA